MCMSIPQIRWFCEPFLFDFFILVVYYNSDVKNIVYVFTYHSLTKEGHDGRKRKCLCTVV